MHLYRPIVAVVEMQSRLDIICKRILDKGELSGNDILYGLWYALMIFNLAEGQLPGDNKIRTLLDRYGNPDLTKEFNLVHKIYKKSNGKKGQSFNCERINSFLLTAMQEAESIITQASDTKIDFSCNKDEILYCAEVF